MEDLAKTSMIEAENKKERSSEKTLNDDINLMDVLIFLARHKRRIIGIPLVLAALAGAASFALPNVYKTSAKIMPPQQNQSGAAALLSQLGGMGGMAAGVAGLKSNSDLYIGMLKSRTVADRLISQFKLKSAYDTESQEKARKKLEDNTTISTGKDGLITIDVEDEDRQRVPQIANAYVSQLQQLTKELAVTEAAQRRLFYEQQLEQAKNNLASAEISLKKSLDTNGVISVDNESRAIVETVGRLRAQVSVKEIELNSMRSFVTESNPDYRRKQQELSSLQAELYKLENGRGNDNVKVGSPAQQAGLQNIKLLRDVKYYQMLYELLAKQYEVARLDEAKDPSMIQVLDPAQEPERKFKPKRFVIVLLGAIAGLFISVIFAWWSDLKSRKASPKYAAKLSELKSHL